MHSTDWSEWQSVAIGWSPTPEVLRETIDGGQSFRWFSGAEPPTRRPVRHSSQSDGGSLGEVGSASDKQYEIPVWTGLWSDHVAQLQLHEGNLQWRAPSATAANTGPALRHYLGADTDWNAFTDSLPWRSDPHLRRCLEAFPGLRILRQPFGETLLGFLCSSTKQIPQIKQMLAQLAEQHGSPLIPPSAFSAQHSASVSRLPSWPQLASLSERDLRACRLGFRAGYIHDTARFLAKNPGWLDATAALPYAAAHARLCELPGVGAKIADCVLLFGAGQLEAFPVDTWILKSLARRYGLDGWKPAQVAQFGRAHFGPLAGLAQQYLFAWERRYGGKP